MCGVGSGVAPAPRGRTSSAAGKPPGAARPVPGGGRRERHGPPTPRPRACGRPREGPTGHTPAPSDRRYSSRKADQLLCSSAAGPYKRPFVGSPFIVPKCDESTPMQTHLRGGVRVGGGSASQGAPSHRPRTAPSSHGHRLPPGPGGGAPTPWWGTWVSSCSGASWLIHRVYRSVESGGSLLT